MEENDDLKKELVILKKENIALKIKWVQKDQINKEKSIQPEETDDTRIEDNKKEFL